MCHPGVIWNHLEMIPCLGQGHQKEPLLVFLSVAHSVWLLSVYRGVLITTLAVFCLHLCISDKTFHDLSWLMCTLHACITLVQFCGLEFLSLYGSEARGSETQIY